jgi:hypothetical protein
VGGLKLDKKKRVGVNLELGRTLAAALDAAPGSSPVAVISDGFWTRRFARSPLVLGKPILLNGIPVTIIGVSAGRFAGLQMGSPMQIFVPIAMQPLILPRSQNGSVSLLDRRSHGGCKSSPDCGRIFRSGG